MQELPKRALLERLLADRKITREQHRAVLEHAQTHGTRLEDALVDTGALDEPALLAWLSTIYQTRFVSTEKLARAEIERATLTLVPRELAERARLFPVLYDAMGKTLSFVTADPDNVEVARELRTVTRVANVKPYLARPAAVLAAIAKHYNGDIHAFSKVEQRSVQKNQQYAAYVQNLFDEETLASRSTTGLRSSPAFDDPQPASRSLPAPPLERALPLPIDIGSGRGASLPPGPGLGVGLQRDPALLSRGSRPSNSGAQESGVTFASSIELVNVLVSLSENQRPHLRGHSASVARLAHKVADHLQLARAEVYAQRLSGLLHDIGKTASYHLTALNVAEYESHRVEAQRSYLHPARLFDSATLPKSAVESLTFMYERFDGRGFPERRGGKEIPLSARLLAIADSYADLTANEKNPFRHVLTPKAAMEVLERYRDSVFDGNLLDQFRVAAMGPDMQLRLLNDKGRILLVDPELEDTIVLELRLLEQGHEVIVCRTAEQAAQRVQQGGIDLIITELELKPHDGFTLLEHLRKRGGPELPVLFLTRRAERTAAERAFALGAVDYISKPAAPDVVVAKVRSVLSRAVQRRGAGGVSGALREMPLPDVIQVLSRTKKSGVLRVSHGERRGEIQLGHGSIYDASFLEMRGEEALYALLALSEGEFQLDPNQVPTQRVINGTTEQLLLEAMRRIDEARPPPTPRADFATTRVDDD